jgi:hypothetical protein
MYGLNATWNLLVDGVNSFGIFDDFIFADLLFILMNKVHLDACEEAFDQPLMYEAGWGKKLNFTFAVSPFGITDVTPRYTRNFDEVSLRRNIDEEVLAKVICF